MYTNENEHLHHGNIKSQPETNVLFVTRNHANVSAASSDDATNLEETSQIVDLTE